MIGVRLTQTQIEIPRWTAPEFERLVFASKPKIVPGEPLPTITSREEMLQVAERAARAGGAVARRRLGDAGYLRWRGNRDVECRAALEVQDAIAAVLTAEDAGAAVLAEEGPEEAPIAVEAEHLWIVDPICGSLNYAQGIPHFGVSVALRVAGQIEAGNVALFREHYIHVFQPSPASKAPAGWYPDALIPIAGGDLAAK